MEEKMFCNHCGNKLADDAKFCANCGAPVAGAPETPEPAVPAQAAPETPAPEPEAPAQEPEAVATPAPTPSTPAPETPAPEAIAPTKAKSPNKNLIIILSVVGGLIFCVGAFFLIKTLTSPSNNNPNEQQNLSNVIAGTKTVTFGKYAVDFSEDYRYEIDTEYYDEITILDKKQNVLVSIEAHDDEYDDYEDEKAYLQKAMSGSSLYYDDVNVEIRQESGKEIVYATGKDKDDDSISLSVVISLDDIPGYVATGLTSGYIELEALVPDGQTADSVYKNYIAPLINSLKYVGSASNAN